MPEPNIYTLPDFHVLDIKSNTFVHTQINKHSISVKIKHFIGCFRTPPPKNCHSGICH